MIETSTAVRPRPARAPLTGRLAARLVLGQLKRWHASELSIELPDGRLVSCGPPRAARRVDVRVKDWRFFRRALTAGDMGVGESYMAGEWECSDLVELCRLFLADQAVLTDRSPWTVVTRLAHALHRRARANTRRGSRRNISQHYDLSNDLFRLFLDDTLSYSAAVFPHAGATLGEAQIHKLDGICRALDLQPDQHVLEIGGGWGGFALHAAQRYGCRVTSLTLSSDQLAVARQRVESAGLAERVDIRLCDYRDIQGRFDHLVSIEMFEAVGLEYYDTFFAACERLLRAEGRMFLQTITMPDQRFAAYARDYDWTRKYIFPGSLLASLREITASLERVTTLRIASLRDIAPDYARTLRCWRERFLDRQREVRQLGFDQRFIRMWEYYLSFCEAAFDVRHIQDLQLVLGRKPPAAEAARRGVAAPTP
jgi:cyclopropane-fatty-acyl-phospholipid synthase